MVHCVYIVERGDPHIHLVTCFQPHLDLVRPLIGSTFSSLLCHCLLGDRRIIRPVQICASYPGRFCFRTRQT